MPTDTEWAYLAGIIDGEGSIYVAAVDKYQQPRISITNTDRRLLLWVQHITGGGSINFRDYAHRNGHWKPCWNWRAAANQMTRILQMVRPYLIIKGEQADLALEFIRLGIYNGESLPFNISRKREYLTHKIRALNHRGNGIHLSPPRRPFPQSRGFY
jgi:hypothetical protein